MRARSGSVCVMPGRALVFAGAVVLASGCAWIAPWRGDGRVAGAGGDPCAYEIVDASAWVNRMPGPEPSDARPLIVSAELADTTTRAVLETRSATPGGVLMLEITASDDAPIPGRLAWRGPVPREMYDRVEIHCSGDLLHVIDEIESVY